MTEELKINRALDAMRKNENGSKAIEILYIITYFAPENNIPLRILSQLVMNEKKLIDAVQLLKEYSIIYSNLSETLINIYETVQKIMISIIDKQQKKLHVLGKALELLFTQGINITNLNHAISVWSYASSHPQLIEKFCGFPFCIVAEFNNQMRFAEGDTFGSEALDLLRKILGKSHPGTFALQHNMGILLQIAGKHERSLELLLPLYRSNMKHLELRNTLITIARQVGYVNKFNEALKIYEQGLFCNAKVSEADDKLMLSAWQDYANVLCETGKYCEASDILKELLKRRKQILGTEDGDTLSLKSNLAQVYLKQSKYSKALKIFHNVFEMNKEIFGENHIVTLRSRRDIALVYQQQARFDEALAIYEVVTEKLKQLLGTEQEETLAVQTNLATLLQQTGQFQKALETYKCVYEKQSKKLGKKHADVLRLKYHIAMILFAQDKHDEGLKIIQEVHQAYIEVLGPNHPKTVDIENTLEIINNGIPESMIAAALENKLSKDKSTIQGNIDINNVDAFQKSPLYYAAEDDDVEVVKYLLSKGAIYNSESAGGKTPFETTENSEIRKLLILVEKFMKDVREGNNEQVLKHIVKEKSIVNAKDKDGSNALHWAVHNGHKDIVKLLLESGADATHITNKGNTPLHIATSKGRKDIMEVLLQHVSRDDLYNFINAKTTTGEVRSIHVAAKNGCLEIVKCLLKHGAIYNVKNKQGKTPLQLSKDQNITNLFKLTDELFQDAKNGNPGLISKLQHLKPDEFIALTSARNDDGNTLLLVTITNNYKSIASQFLEIVKEMDETKPSLAECSIEQLDKLKIIAEVHIKFSKKYLPKLRRLSEPYESEKNPSPWLTLKEGSYYLGNCYQLVDKYKEYTNGATDNRNIEAIYAALLDLQYDESHMTEGYTDEAYDGMVECFVSTGQGMRYYESLHSKFKKDVRLFVEMVEQNIDVPVRSFLASVKQKLKSALPQRLFKAIENGDFLEVHNCIGDGVDVNVKNTDGGTSLHYAVYHGNLVIVCILLENGADVTQVTAKGNTPLHIATSKSHKEIVEVLLQHASCDKLNDLVNAQTTVAGTASLHVAAKNGSVDIVKSLLKHGAIFNIENKEGKRPLDLSQDQNIINLLKQAENVFEDAKNGNLDIILKLQDIKIDEFSALTNARNNQGNTLLQVAITNEHRNVENRLTEMLKNHKRRLDRLTRLKEVAAAHITYSEKYFPSLQSMLDPNELKKSNAQQINITEGSSYLKKAHDLVQVYKDCTNSLTDDKNIQIVNDMLVKLQFDPKHNTTGYTDEARGEEIEFTGSRGQGAKYYELLQSQFTKDLKLFLEMIEHSIELPIKSFLESIERTLQSSISEIFFKAIENNNHMEVENCIKEGVDVNTRNTDSGTPLHYAVNIGNLDIINLLLKNGADATQVTIKGNTSLHIATSKGHKEIVEVLLQHANHNELNDLVNAQTTVAGTASLHVAARNGSIDIVKSLLKYGAIYNIKNKEGKTPLNLSKDLNVIHLFKLIRELFQGAEKGDFEIISKLRCTESNEFITLTNTRNNRGNTILQVALINKYKNVTSKYLELFRKPDLIQSWPLPNSKLEKYEMLQEVTELHINTSQLYLLELRSMSVPFDSERNPFSPITLKDGISYLRNVRSIVEIYKWCTDNSIDNEFIQVINDILTVLDFDPEHVTSYTNEDCTEQIESLVSKVQNTHFYKLLYSESKQDVRFFLKLVEPHIEVNVNKFSKSIEQKLEYVLPEKFFEAIESNNYLEVENRIKAGVVINCKTTDGRTPLHYAVNNGNSKIINVLLKNGADVTKVTSKGNTPLHIATSKDFEEIVIILLQYVSKDKINSFINAQTVGGATSLHIAAKNGSWNIVKALLVYGAIYNMQNKEGKTPLDLSTNQDVTNLLKQISELFENARKGDPEIISKLEYVGAVELVAITNACDDQGDKLLEVAAINKRKNIENKISEIPKKPDETIQTLSTPKLNLDKIEKLKQAAELYIQCSQSYLPMLRNSSQSNRSEKNSFPWATLKAGSYYLQNVYSLVEVYKGCMNGLMDDKNIQAVNHTLVELEFHPKHITLGYTDEAFNGKIECFVSKGQGTKYYELLHSELKKDVRSFVEMVQSSIDINVKLFFKSIKHKLQSVVSEMLFTAIENNNNSDVRNCLREESVVNSNKTDGKTPLHYAVNNGNLSIINTLLKHGADVSRVDYKGETPLHIACSKGNKKIVEIMLQHLRQDKLNDFINAQIVDGTTSLHIATKNGFLEVVECLLKHGAIYNIKNQEGKTPIDLSKKQNITNLLKLIDTLFEDARSGNFKMIHKLKTQPCKITAVTNTRNDQGKTLIQVAIFNKHQSLANKLEITIKTKSNSTGC